ncbi:DNAH2 [Symbiodinium natans]|uniref:DNAH2 protein n=1 Tax=Symbiodinium natans TaxID=878477 RepID=A0A812U5E2_9DINO|nr:DNAH2 [Symbiodinium natans]
MEQEIGTSLARHASDMEDAVGRIDMSDLAEVKRLAKMSDEMCQVLNTVVWLLFDLRPLARDTWKIKLFEPDLLKKLQGFHWDDVTEEMMQTLDEHFANPAVSVENMESFRGPAMVKHLSKWLWATRGCGKTAVSLKPKKEQLCVLQLELENLHRELALIS